MSLAEKTGHYFPALTGLRAVAAYLVFFHHFNPAPDRSSFLFKFFDQGLVGINIFYVLSGLLICIRYYDHVEASRKWAVNYMRNRIARIYPLYFLLTVLTLLVAQFAPGLGVMQEWQSYSTVDRAVVSFVDITMLKGFSETLKFSGIGPGWSLTVEESFYLTAPFLILALYRSKKFFFIFAAMLLSLGVLLTAFFSRHYVFGFFNSYPFTFYYTFFGRCIEFFMGMRLALYIKEHPVQKPGKPLATTIGALWILAVMVLLAYYDIHFLSAPGQVLLNLFMPLGVCALLYGLVAERGVLSTVLSSSLFDLLGRSSYAFYLVHTGVFSALIINYLNWPLFARFLALNVLAILLYKSVEHPLQKALSRRK
ncbi:acyltransferase family protein [Hymenobacter persicinus]|uniref:Acyltransferase n=1 Tax=Hymenobacter persicinus TaxID=2025506 RepID=A0A4Q5LB27_9BACT|nr:acyltransferase [Hymenobacter persicinus]RYU76070.1 acyltransferase [Hymenobacter persicinus]